MHKTFFDVFLCHNSLDKPNVKRLAKKLKQRKMEYWLDLEQLIPGQPWQEALEKAMQRIKAVLVLIGKDGLGPWQKREMRIFISEFVDRGCHVIPVLLPGAPDIPNLPLFLKEHQWVDLRKGLTKEGIDQIVWGITGIKP
jgi:hypothetical protein